MILTPLHPSIEVNQVYEADLFDLCDSLPDQSVDMILCDLPYGTTACSWDTVIPFAPMWERFKRVIKPKGAIVLTASQPFTSALVMSAVNIFRYSWIWEKSVGTGFLDANRKPLKCHEDVLVFSLESTNYYPQMIQATRRVVQRSESAAQYGKHLRMPTDNRGMAYPRSIVRAVKELGTVHPTQKPVALFRYLIRTYTQPGELVLDPTCGSGTTAIAAREEGRNFICGDSSAEYVEVAKKRLAEPYTLPLFQFPREV